VMAFDVAGGVVGWQRWWWWFEGWLRVQSCMLWKDQIYLRWRPHLILLPILEFIARVQNKHNDKLVKGEYNLFLLTMFENIFIVFFFCDDYL
jgi:hypothetical protein